jgi:hypothetical protein
MRISWENGASILRGSMALLPGTILEIESTIAPLLGIFEIVVTDVSVDPPSVSIRKVNSVESVLIGLESAAIEYEGERGEWSWSLTAKRVDDSWITFSRRLRPV